MRNIILTNLNFVTAQVLKSLVWEEHWAFLSNVFQITKALKQNQQHINKNKPPHLPSISMIWQWGYKQEKWNLTLQLPHHQVYDW